MVGQGTVEFKIDGVQEELIVLQEEVFRAAVEGMAAHEVERRLFQKLLALGHKQGNCMSSSCLAIPYPFDVLRPALRAGTVGTTGCEASRWTV